MNFRVDRKTVYALLIALPFSYVKTHWPEPVREINVPTGYVVKAKSLRIDDMNAAIQRFTNGHTVLLPEGAEQWGYVTVGITNRIVFKSRSKLYVAGAGDPNWISNRVVYLD